MKTMKKVLWVSRHTMTPEQYADLERVLQGPVQLVPWPDTVRDVAELTPTLEQVDAVAAVLPLRMLGQLLARADGKPVLQAISGRQATGRMVENAAGDREPEFAFVHRGWQQILRLELETRML